MTLDQNLKHHVPDAECRIYAAHQKDFVLRRNLLYLRVTPKRSNKDVLVFVVPGLKCQAAIDGCHCYLGHQGRDRSLSLLKERFWWPGMAQRMMMSVRNCPKCHIFEAKPQIPPMEPILCTELLDLVHIDYVSMEVTVGVTEKPVMKNVLVIEDHFREMPSIRWLNAWQTGYQRMRSRMTRTRKDKYSTGHDCFFGSLNRKVSCSG